VSYHKRLASGIVIRSTRKEDAEALEQLQLVVFPTLEDSERFKRQHYLKHIEIFAEGQFVAIDGERVVGMTSTVRLPFDFDHAQHSFADVLDGGWLTSHDPEGDWLYGADVGTHPEYRRRGIARGLYAGRQDTVTRLGLLGQVTVGMLRGYGALNAVNTYLGDAVGRAYAERYFPASARDQVQTMVDNIKAAFAQRIQGLDWMAATTREEALRKVNTIEVGVGYPDTWRDYSSYEVSADNAYANAIAGERHEYAHQLAKLGRPMDRREWWMTPQTVNAVNLPVQNALNFPAAILQPPFFDANADAAYNYGAIGAVIGHEVSHSFDNNGAAFDSTGALRNWWTDADAAAFREQGEALARQFDEYEALPGLHLNGTLTLGENIADLAGLQAAHAAYRASLGGREAPVIDGLTGDQRFFLAYAQVWQTKMRDEAMRQRVVTGSHAPGMYRALSVRNLDGWYEAFGVEPTDAQYIAPEARVRVW
jgi:predicted metalloendopeptidase